MDDLSNRREFLRVHVAVNAEVAGSAHGLRSGIAHDASMRGFYLACDKAFPLDETCKVTIYLEGRENEASIEANGHVVRSDHQGMAIELDSLVGFETYQHLQNLVMYNALDPATAEEEIMSHLGIRRK